MVTYLEAILKLFGEGRHMKAVGYIRVSTEEQAREGVSLDNPLLSEHQLDEDFLT